MTTGDRIRNARMSKGLTQKQLAEACGIPQGNICRIERMAGEPRTKTVKAIEAALGVTGLAG